jgi:hypothetical protein
MSRPDSAPALRRVLGPTVPVLLAVVLVLAYESHRPLSATLLLGVIGVLGVSAGVGLRALRFPVVRELALLPVLVALGVLALETPASPLGELLVGASGVVFVAWLLDDPSRPPAGATRGALEWAIPGLAVGLAWASAFLLPAGAAPLGVAGGLLAAVLIVLAYIVRRPQLFDHGQGATI